MLMTPIFIKFIGIIIFNGAANKLYPYNKKLLKIIFLINLNIFLII